MQAKEIRELSADELALREREFKESLFMLKLRQGTNQLESSARLVQTRRDLARIHTIRRERELSNRK